MSYELLLFVHVVSAVVWVGTVVATQAIAWRMINARDTTGLLRFMKHAEVLGKIIGAAAVALLIAGILLVEKLGISYTTPWVLIGLIGFATSMVIGGVIAMRESNRAHALAEVNGAESAEVVSSLRRVWTTARVDTAILLVVVWAMTWKPGA